MDAGSLYPRPRDLTGQLRVRSTPAGQPATEDDILAVVLHGVPGAPMPGHSLSGAERAGLLAYLKQLSPGLARPAVPIAVEPEPAETPASIAAGQALYARLGCADCHGPGGRGDGEQADVLVDEHDLACPPRDLVLGPYKGGARAREIYVRLTTGMDGSPMAAVSEAQASRAERWQLAHYVASLAAGSPPADAGPAGAGRAGAGGELAVRSRRVDARPAPDEPLAAAWRSAPALEVPLFPLWSRPRAGARLTVRSMHDRRGVAIRIDWPDDSQSDRSGPTDFSDAVAVQLVDSATPAFVGMGDARTAVTIWHWKADWQRLADERRPGRAPGARGAALEYPFPVQPASDAGNPHVPGRHDTAVEEGSARGAGTFTARPVDARSAAGRGVWIGGRWYVVLTREYAVASIPDRVAFAIWDGALGDRAGHKLVSGWYPLIVEAP